MRKPRETDTVAAILQFLALHKIPAWRMSVGAFRAEYKGRTRFHRFGVTGMSDIVGILPLCMVQSCEKAVLGCPRPGHVIGQWLAVEVKSATGKTTKAQEDFLGAVTAAGGKAFVARDVATVAKELGL